jgi:hypothetical protein
MIVKRWIIVVIINALLLSGAFQVYAMSKYAGQPSSHASSNVNGSFSKFLFLPLAVNNSSMIPEGSLSPTPSLTITETPSGTLSLTTTVTQTPTFTETLSTSPTMTLTPSPTYIGIPPTICEKHSLPTGSDAVSIAFSYELGPVLRNYVMNQDMVVSVVNLSANLSANGCTIGQQLILKGNLVGSWTYHANGYNLYSERSYFSATVHKNDPINYSAYAVDYNCTGTIKGASNFIEICGDPIP